MFVEGLAQAFFPHFFGEVQRFAQQLWISNTGFVYTLNFVPWMQVESIRWDNDIGQQSYGVQFRYTLKGRKKTLKLWIPRDRKTECVRTLAKYMNPNTAENLLAHDEQYYHQSPYSKEQKPQTPLQVSCFIYLHRCRP